VSAGRTRAPTAAAPPPSRTLAGRTNGAGPEFAPRDAEPPDPYVGFVTRLIAFCIDAAVIDGVALIAAAVVALVTSLLPSLHIEDHVTLIVGGVAFALWATTYFVASWNATGQTLGDHAMRIVVRRADGGRVRVRTGLIRLVGMVIGAPFLIGYLPILVTSRRRGFHDWLAGTVVTPLEQTPVPGSRARARR
jgi:uncharacterized RDD family membrane protein YckC